MLPKRSPARSAPLLPVRNASGSAPTSTASRRLRRQARPDQSVQDDRAQTAHQAEHDAAVAAATLAWRTKNNADDSDIPPIWPPNGMPRRGSLLPRKNASRTSSRRCGQIPAGAPCNPWRGSIRETGLPTKAPIFSVDLLADPVTITQAENIHDALAVCLDQHQRVDVAHIAALLADTEDSVREQLRGLVYPSLSDPDHLIPAVTALSGNVRRKLVNAAPRPTPTRSTPTTSTRVAG
jgi:hypothetical protein